MSDSVNFAEYIESERARLTEKRAAAHHELAQWQYRIDMIDTEFAAIAAYEAVKTGKAVQPARGSATTHARRGSRREGIMTQLSQSPNGMKRGELLDALGVKGDKAGEMSVSNALNAMRKAGRVVHLDSGRWAASATEGLREAAE